MDFSTYRKEIDLTLSEISSNLEKMTKNFLERFGITVLQYKILSVIYEKEIIKIGELSNHIIMDAGNMSSMCKKLEKSGYLIRKRNIEDERIVEVSLTNKSKDIVVKLNNIFDEKFRYFFINEDDKTLEDILNILKKLDKYFINMSTSFIEKKNEKGE